MNYRYNPMNSDVQSPSRKRNLLEQLGSPELVRIHALSAEASKTYVLSFQNGTWREGILYSHRDSPQHSGESLASFLGPKPQDTCPYA